MRPWEIEKKGVNKQKPKKMKEKNVFINMGAYMFSGLFSMKTTQMLFYNVTQILGNIDSFFLAWISSITADDDDDDVEDHMYVCVLGFTRKPCHNFWW